MCSHELAKGDKCYDSLWTLDGQQITDLNDLPEDTRICLVSYLPMAAKKDPKQKKNEDG